MNTERKRGNRVIKATGEEIPVAPPANSVAYTFVELSVLIGGGLIELIRIDQLTFTVVDENYLAKELPLNHKATWLYREMALRNGYLTDHVVLGDVAIIAQEQIQ